MTERERAAWALWDAERELQAAVRAQLRSEPGGRDRLRWAKVHMDRAHRRGLRALGLDAWSETPDGPGG